MSQNNKHTSLSPFFFQILIFLPTCVIFCFFSFYPNQLVIYFYFFCSWFCCHCGGFAVLVAGEFFGTFWFTERWRRQSDKVGFHRWVKKRGWWKKGVAGGGRRHDVIFTFLTENKSSCNLTHSTCTLNWYHASHQRVWL